jgi:hypothetical protein
MVTDRDSRSNLADAEIARERYASRPGRFFGGRGVMRIGEITPLVPLTLRGKFGGRVVYTEQGKPEIITMYWTSKVSKYRRRS